MEENNFIIGTNCSSYDPDQIQCDKQAELPIHLLNKYCEENDLRYDIYPLSIIQAIFDGKTGTRLDRILAMCNSTYLTWEGTFQDTLIKMGKEYRRKGYIITYKDETGINWTQRFNSDDISDDAWTDSNNWEGWSFDTIIEDLSKAIEEIFKNIGDYKEFYDIIIGSIGDFIVEVFNNIKNYPDLINIIKNTAIEGLPIVIKEIFNNINDYPEIKNIFNQYIKQWTETIFNNISSYPELANYINTSINNYVTNNINNIFNNIDNYPILKTLITNSTKEQVTNIFNNINNYPELKKVIENFINSKVENIFTNLDNYPDLISLISDSVCVCVKNIFTNISNYPALVTCINNVTNTRVDYIFNNISKFPILENLITNKVIARVTYIFNNVNEFPKVIDEIKKDIENIFISINNYPALKILIEDKTKDTTIDILSNIDNYPTVKTPFTKFVNDTIDTRRGQNNGVASLDDKGKIPSEQLPSYVDDVLEGYYQDETHFIEKYIDNVPVYYTPESGKIYVDISEDTENSGKTYRWSGTQYVVISETIVIGEVKGTAYDGAKGKYLSDKVTTIDTNLAKTNENVTENTKNIDKLEKNIVTITSRLTWEKDNKFTVDDKFIEILERFQPSPGIVGDYPYNINNLIKTNLEVNGVHHEGSSYGYKFQILYMSKYTTNNNSIFIGFGYRSTYNKTYGITTIPIFIKGSYFNPTTWALYVTDFDFYTKSEIDTKLEKLSSKDSTYTKTEVNKAIQDAIKAIIPDGYELVIKKKTE